MKVNELIFLVEDDPGGGYSAKALGQSMCKATLSNPSRTTSKTPLDVILTQRKKYRPLYDFT